MSSMESGRAASDEDDGSWAQESLPLAVRRQLLERELKKLAARHASAQPGGSTRDAQQQQGQSDHPSADAPAHDEHGG